jgi:Protein of unknown function (DUF4232)
MDLDAWWAYRGSMPRWMLVVLVVVAAVSVGGYALAQPSSAPKTSSSDRRGWTSYAPLAPLAWAADIARVRCPASVLTVSERKLRSSPFGEASVFTITNVGRATCSIVGVPRLTLIGSGAAYAPPQTVASHGATVRLAPHRTAAFWVDFLAPEGQGVAGAQQLSIAVSGMHGSIDVPLPAAARTSQQLIVSAVVPGTVTKLPASVGVARRCAAAALSLTVRPLDEQAGSSYDVFILRNTTTTVCSVQGVARLSIADRLGRRLYDLPQRTGSFGSGVDLSGGGRASFWVLYPDACANFGVGRLSEVAARQVLALPGTAGTVSAPGSDPRSWPRKCPVVVSALTAGVFRMAPGFTDLALQSAR